MTTTRSLPQHGERRFYLRGCRCADCCAAHKRYCKEYDLRRHRNGPRNHDATQAAAHLHQHIAEGWTQPALAEAIDIPEHTIRDLIYRPNPKTSTDNIRRILAFQPIPGVPPANYWINPVGAIRRIQALAAIGHPIYTVADAIDVGESTLRHIIAGSRAHVSRDLAARIARLYDDWSRKPGPSPYTRGRAAANQWLDPEYWEDTGRIDDPGFDPHESPAPRYIVLAEDGQELERQGYSRPLAAERLGVTLSHLNQCYSRWRKDQAAAAAEQDSEAAA